MQSARKNAKVRDYLRKRIHRKRTNNLKSNLIAELASSDLFGQLTSSLANRRIAIATDRSQAYICLLFVISLCLFFFFFEKSRSDILVQKNGERFHYRCFGKQC
jgi:hypothetical protein